MLIDTIGLNNQQSPLYGENTSLQNDNTNELRKDDFLKLLVSQLKHQDPLNPLESVDFTAQLAQFSSLEQLFGMNDTLVDIQNSLASRDDSNILDYIGKSAKINDSAIAVKDGGADTGTYVLEDPADVNIFIYKGSPVSDFTV